MKKFLVLAFGLLSLFNLSACTEKDARTIYEEALNNMKELDSVKMTVDMEIAMNDGESSLNIPLDMVFIGEKMNDEDPLLYLEMSSDFMGETTISKQWIKDNKTYSDVDGNKEILESATLKDSDEVFDFDFSQKLENATISSEDDYIKLASEISFEDLKSLLSSTTSASSSLDLIDTDDPVLITIFISEDQYIDHMKLSYSSGMQDGESASFDISYNYSDFDKAKVPDFDPTEFGELYESGYVYGLYDLTYDNANDLIARGYKDMGDYVYYNGEYNIDLEYKRLYDDDATIIYDWEYDQSTRYDEDMKVVCTFDFTFNNFVEGEDQSCDRNELEAYRDAYNELAKSILE